MTAAVTENDCAGRRFLKLQHCVSFCSGAATPKYVDNKGVWRTDFAILSIFRRR